MGARMDLDGARTLVTGATGGLGRAIATALARRGADVVVTGRRRDVLDELANRIGGTAVVADLADPEAVDTLLEAAGELDVLVANAALPATGDVRDHTPEQVRRQLRVNLEAPILLARGAATGMADRGRGHIVAIGSMAGITSSPSTSLYNAAKFGLRGFVLALREDLHGSGVGASVVEPSFVREAGMFVEGGGRLPPFVRMVSPDDVVAGVLTAIDHDRPEVVVAPVEMRALARVGSVFPRLSAAVQRPMVGEFGTTLAENQRHTR